MRNKGVMLGNPLQSLCSRNIFPLPAMERMTSRSFQESGKKTGYDNLNEFVIFWSRFNELLYLKKKKKSSMPKETIHLKQHLQHQSIFAQ